MKCKIEKLNTKVFAASCTATDFYLFKAIILHMEEKINEVIEQVNNMETLKK